MRTLALALVFLSGSAIMILEIVGARFLARDFGSSFYVWVSQIGVVLTALALGYWFGGILAIRKRRLVFLGWLTMGSGVFLMLIPEFAAAALEAIVDRHPLDRDIPLIWQKLDPALGSALIFLLPCCVLAMFPPVIVRSLAQEIPQVGLISGLVYAASTIGSIGGVFVAGYILIDYLSLPMIFRGTGMATVALGVVSACLKNLSREPRGANATATNHTNPA